MIPVNISRGDQFKPEFLAISPNNRMPAIVDPTVRAAGRSRSSSPARSCISGRKTGKFYPRDERGRVEVEQWLYLADGQSWAEGRGGHHFRHYAPREIAYAIDRFTNEINRLFGVMDRASRTANSSPASIRSPTWPASAGCGATASWARTSTISQSQALVRDREGAPGCGARHPHPGRGGRARRHARPQRARGLCSISGRADVANSEWPLFAVIRPDSQFAHG